MSSICSKRLRHSCTGFAALLLLLSFTSAAVAEDDYDAGKRFFAKKDYRSAKVYFDKAVAQAPWDSSILYYDAVSSQYLRDFNSAKVSYRKLVEQFPGTDAAKNARAALNALDPGWEQREAHASKTSKGRSTGGSSTAAPAGEAANLPPVQISAPPKTRVPLTRIGDKPYVDARVNGRSQRLEYSGDETTINMKDALGLGLVDRNKPVAVGTKVLVTLSIVDITEKNFPVVIGADTERSRLGEDAFKNFNVSLEPSSILAHYRMSSGRGPNDVPFRMNGKDMVVDLTVNGRRVTAVFDEHAGECVVPANRARDFGLDVQEKSEYNMYDPIKNPNGPNRGDPGYGEVKKSSFAEGRVQMGPANASGIRFKVDETCATARIGPSALAGWKVDVDKTAGLLRLSR